MTTAYKHKLLQLDSRQFPNHLGHGRGIPTITPALQGGQSEEIMACLPYPRGQRYEYTLGCCSKRRDKTRLGIDTA